MSPTATRPSVLFLLPFLHYGVGRLVLNLAAAIRSRGIGCSLVTCGRCGNLGDDPAMIDEIRDTGALCRHADLFTRDDAGMKRAAEEIGEVWRESRPSLAHAFTAPAAAAALDHGPVTATVVGWGQQKLPWQKQMDIEILDRCAKVTAVSQAMRAELREAGLRRSDVALILNGVAIGGPLRRSSGAHRVRIGVMAHLIRRKGIDVLLEALPLVYSRFPIELLIAGTGDAETELKRQASRYSDSVAVSWLGEQPLPDFLEGIDLLVVPSRSDALPLILLQAMASGLPIVATAVGGIPEAIRNEVEGLLVPPEDPPALASAIGRMIADPELARNCGLRARSRVEQEFSSEAMIRNYLRCYCELVPALSSSILPGREYATRIDAKDCCRA